MPTNEYLARKLAEKANELVRGMHSRVKRDPDIADFESAFKILLNSELMDYEASAWNAFNE